MLFLSLDPCFGQSSCLQEAPGGPFLPHTTPQVRAYVTNPENPKNFNTFLELENKPEILLIGCGKVAKLVPEEIRDIMRNQGIVVEPMGTGAACRTFNVLVLEERNVAAALLPIE